MKRVIGAACLFSCTMLAMATSAAAYLDPSAMTYVIQAVAGVVIAGGAAIVIYWRKIKLKVKKGKKAIQKDAAPATQAKNVEREKDEFEA